MGWVPDNVIDELRGSHQLGIFLRIATDPALHMSLQNQRYTGEF